MTATYILGFFIPRREINGGDNRLTIELPREMAPKRGGKVTDAQTPKKVMNPLFEKRPQ